ncbi:MAG: amidohydrolase [Candidatus Heimdallarchaeota archaeon]|nr:amidohydrolase [Candidatus Heimdallarchaeota archaeon]
MSIAILDSWILSLKGDNLGIIENGAVGIRNGKIDFVGPTSKIDKKNYDKTINGTNHVTMPGLVNAHIHSGMTILRGGAQDVPEIEWMNKAIGPLAKHMTPNDAILGSKLGVIEGLKSGTTTFAEYAGNVSRIVDEVYIPFGVRVVATETINEVSRDRAYLKPTDLYEFDRSKGEEAFQRANDLFIKYSRNDLVTSMYGPQALDMISIDLLDSIRSESIEDECSFHMHVAQGNRERLQIIGRYGKDSSTVKVLEKNGFLDKYLLGAHCHDTTFAERELMVKKGAKMVGCPSSISMIDGIVPPVGDYVSLGGIVGLGSDQAPGPGLHNMFCEMRTISILTKTMKKDPTVLPAWEVLQLATKGGAKALGLDNSIGSLEIGKKADIITIDLSKPNLTPSVSKPFRNFVPNIVYSATGFEVDNVIINGKEIISKNQFIDIDEQKIVIEVNKRALEIFESAEEDWRKANSELVKKVDKGFL